MASTEIRIRLTHNDHAICFQSYSPKVGRVIYRRDKPFTSLAEVMQVCLADEAIAEAFQKVKPGQDAPQEDSVG